MMTIKSAIKLGDLIRVLMQTKRIAEGKLW